MATSQLLELVRKHGENWFFFTTDNISKINAMLSAFGGRCVNSAVLSATLANPNLGVATLRLLARANPNAVTTAHLNSVLIGGMVHITAETFRVLVDANRDAVGSSHLSTALRGGHSLETIEVLVGANPLLLATAAPLHDVIRADNPHHFSAPGIIEYLLSNGANPIQRDDHLTPVEAIAAQIKSVRKKYGNKRGNSEMDNWIARLNRYKVIISDFIRVKKERDKDQKAKEQKATRERKAKQKAEDQQKMKDAWEAAQDRFTNIEAQLESARGIRERMGAILSKPLALLDVLELKSTSTRDVEAYLREALSAEVQTIWGDVFESHAGWSTEGNSKIAEVQLQTSRTATTEEPDSTVEVHRTLVVELQLPTFAAIAKTPALVEKLTQTTKTLLKKDQQKLYYNLLVLRVCLRVADAAFALCAKLKDAADANNGAAGGGAGAAIAADGDDGTVAGSISSVSLTGFVADFSKGKEERKNILACTCNASDFVFDDGEGLGHEEFDPRSFFDDVVHGKFNGVAENKASTATSVPRTSGAIAIDIAPVAPAARIRRIAADDGEYAPDDDDVLEEETNLCGMDPDDFEQVVRKVFEKYYRKELACDAKDFQAKTVKTGTERHAGDRGIDVVLQDCRPIVGSKIVIQCKCSCRTIGPEPVRALCHSIDEHSASKGILVTTSQFGPEAKAIRDTKSHGRIELVDGKEFLWMMEQVGEKGGHYIDVQEAVAKGWHLLDSRRARSNRNRKAAKRKAGDDDDAAEAAGDDNDDDDAHDAATNGGLAADRSTNRRNGKQPRVSSDSDSNLATDPDTYLGGGDAAEEQLVEGAINASLNEERGESLGEEDTEDEDEEDEDVVPAQRAAEKQKRNTEILSSDEEEY